MKKLDKLLKNIQYEATPDRMDDLDKAQEQVLDGMAATGRVVAGAAIGAVAVTGKLASDLINGEEEVEDDEHMMNRWDSANPYMHK